MVFVMQGFTMLGRKPDQTQEPAQNPVQQQNIVQPLPVLNNLLAESPKLLDTKTTISIGNYVQLQQADGSIQTLRTDNSAAFALSTAPSVKIDEAYRFETQPNILSNLSGSDATQYLLSEKPPEFGSLVYHVKLTANDIKTIKANPAFVCDLSNSNRESGAYFNYILSMAQEVEKSSVAFMGTVSYAIISEKSLESELKKMTNVKPIEGPNGNTLYSAKIANPTTKKKEDCFILPVTIDGKTNYHVIQVQDKNNIGDYAKNSVPFHVKDVTYAELTSVCASLQVLRMNGLGGGTALVNTMEKASQLFPNSTSLTVLWDGGIPTVESNANNTMEMSVGESEVRINKLAGELKNKNIALNFVITNNASVTDPKYTDRIKKGIVGGNKTEAVAIEDYEKIARYASAFSGGEFIISPGLDQKPSNATRDTYIIDAKLPSAELVHGTQENLVEGSASPNGKPTSLSFENGRVKGALDTKPHELTLEVPVQFKPKLGDVKFTSIECHFDFSGSVEYDKGGSGTRDKQREQTLAYFKTNGIEAGDYAMLNETDNYAERLMNYVNQGKGIRLPGAVLLVGDGGHKLFESREQFEKAVKFFAEKNIPVYFVFTGDMLTSKSASFYNTWKELTTRTGGAFIDIPELEKQGQPTDFPTLLSRATKEVSAISSGYTHVDVNGTGGPVATKVAGTPLR